MKAALAALLLVSIAVALALAGTGVFMLADPVIRDVGPINSLEFGLGSLALSIPSALAALRIWDSLR